MNTKRRVLLDWERDAIVAGVIAGEKETALAAEFGVSDNYPHKLARRRGVPPRATGRPRKSGQSQEPALDTNPIPSRAVVVLPTDREARNQHGELQGPLCQT